MFVSNRPAAADGKKTGGKSWKVERTAAGWGTSVHVSAQINRGEGVWAPSVAGDGSVYFIRRKNPDAPNDESFIVFGSMHTGPDAHERLFISFRDARG